MKRIQTIVFIITTAIVTTVFGQVENEKPLLERIEELTKVPLSGEVAQQWLTAADEAANDEIRQNMLMAAAAAFIHSRDLNSYRGKVQPLLANVEMFENSIRQYCENCNGEGKAQQPCSLCNGSGRCALNGCMDGWIPVRFKQVGRVDKNSNDGKVEYKKCKKCNGTGYCSECDGEGKLAVVCKKCQGNGWVVKAEKVKLAYHYFAGEAKAAQKKETELKEIEDKRNREQEERNRRIKEESNMRERGLRKIGGIWMPEGSIRNADFFVTQKLFNATEGEIREPAGNEKGGMLCIDNKGKPFCLIMSRDEYHGKFAENENNRCDLYRCGFYSYLEDNDTKKKNIVPLFATDCETALDEISSGRHGRILTVREQSPKKKRFFNK